jgi:hypothetical protein
VRQGRLCVQGRSPAQARANNQVSFTWQGRSHTQFVRRENVAMTRQQLRTYERLRTLVEAWIVAGLELAALRFGTAPVRPRARRKAARRAAPRAKSQ